MHRRELVSMFGRPDIAFHQLVRDIVVFGQQLTRDIERDAVGAVFRDRLAETVCNQIKSFIPTRTAGADLRGEKTTFGIEGLAERRPFGT